jgi:hypothetical protein
VRRALSLALGAVALVGAAGAGRMLTAAGLPSPRAGLWEQTRTDSGQPPSTSRACEDGEPLKSIDMGPGCNASKVTRTKTRGWVVSAHCVLSDATTDARITAEGDFINAFTSDALVVITRKGQPPERRTYHSAWRYIGPCPPTPTPGRPRD